MNLQSLIFIEYYIKKWNKPPLNAGVIKFWNRKIDKLTLETRAEMQNVRYLCCFHQNWNCSTISLKNYPKIKFRGDPFSGTAVRTELFRRASLRNSSMSKNYFSLNSGNPFPLIGLYNEISEDKTNLMPLILLFIQYSFNAQHVSAVNTTIFRSLRLTGCYFIGGIWFGVCWRSVSVWLWRCGVFMQSEARSAGPFLLLHPV